MLSFLEVVLQQFQNHQRIDIRVNLTFLRSSLPFLRSSLPQRYDSWLQDLRSMLWSSGSKFSLASSHDIYRAVFYTTTQSIFLHVCPLQWNGTDVNQDSVASRFHQILWGPTVYFWLVTLDLGATQEGGKCITVMHSLPTLLWSLTSLILQVLESLSAYLGSMHWNCLSRVGLVSEVKVHRLQLPTRLIQSLWVQVRNLWGTPALGFHKPLEQSFSSSPATFRDSFVPCSGTGKSLLLTLALWPVRHKSGVSVLKQQLSFMLPQSMYRH